MAWAPGGVNVCLSCGHLVLTGQGGFRSVLLWRVLILLLIMGTLCSPPDPRVEALISKGMVLGGGTSPGAPSQPPFPRARTFPDGRPTGILRSGPDTGKGIQAVPSVKVEDKSILQGERGGGKAQSSLSLRKRGLLYPKCSG